MQMIQNQMTQIENECRVVVGVIINKFNQILVARRPQNKHLAGFWEFPGGKIEIGEKPQFALRRELFEELGISVLEEIHLLNFTHHYPEKIVHLDVWRVVRFRDEPEGKEGQLVRWVTKTDLQKLAFAEGSRKIVQIVELDYTAS